MRHYREGNRGTLVVANVHVWHFNLAIHFINVHMLYLAGGYSVFEIPKLAGDGCTTSVRELLQRLGWMNKAPHLNGSVRLNEVYTISIYRVAARNAHRYVVLSYVCARVCVCVCEGRGGMYFDLILLIIGNAHLLNLWVLP
jgi:hypothetical protein